MQRNLLRLTVSFLMICAVLSVPALSHSADEATASPAIDKEARIQSLLKMPKQERNEALRALDPQERRGLWFDLKKAQFAAQGVTAKGAAAKGGAAPQGTPLTMKAAPAAPLAVGTIKYDSGVPSTSFGVNALVGNRFNTHDSGIPVFASGSVTAVQAVVVKGTSAGVSGSAGFVLLGPQTGGGGAAALFSSFANGLTATNNTVTFTGLNVNYVGSSFFVLFGDFANSHIPVFGAGTTLGQGHHGVIGVTGGAGPNITATNALGTPLNGFIRASGNIVPVELMQFNID